MRRRLLAWLRPVARRMLLKGVGTHSSLLLQLLLLRLKVRRLLRLLRLLLRLLRCWVLEG